MKHLEGRVAIVTGSGQGVGRGIARILAREGAKVITNNRKKGSESFLKYRPEEMTAEEYKKLLELKGDAETTAQLIREEGGEAMPFYGDVSNHETAREMVEFAIQTYGRLDIVVNNAAGLGKGTICDTTETDWEYMTLAKMKGAYNLMHFAVPHMIKQGFGRVLNCASDAWVGAVNLCAYSAANAGVVGLTWATARELASYNITVNAYCPQAKSPGHVVEFNKMVHTMEESVGKDAVMQSEKLQQVEEDHGEPEDMAPFLAYLCTEEAAYISGSVFSVTGSGKIDVYSNPQRVRQIWKREAPWTVEELMETVPRDLLGKE